MGGLYLLSRVWWIRENTVVYDQIRVPVYYSDSGNIPCAYSRIHNLFFYILVYSKRYYFKSGDNIIYSCIRSNNCSNSVTLFHISVYSMEYLFSYSLIIFTRYCVFDGIVFSNTIFAVTSATKIFWVFMILINVCILVFLGDIGTILIKPIMFNGSITVFQFSNLNVYFEVIKWHVLPRWNRLQKWLFFDTLKGIW